MPTTTLVPLVSPLETLSHLGINLKSAVALEALLAFVFCVWLIYTIIAVYHWLRYSHASLLAFPAILVHLVVSVVIMSYALTGTLLV